jgi:pyridoxal phosphate enzyme (YggS family)
MTVQRNVEAVHEQIHAACRRAGRDAQTVKLMAVTKNQTREAVMEAYEAGVRLFGENRVQEAAEKYYDLPRDLELHLVGHLQRNKAKRAAELFHAVESIDKLETAQALAKRIPGHDASAAEPAGAARMPVFVEVNTSGEETKHGVQDEQELHRLVSELIEIPQLRMSGLMTIGPLTRDEKPLRDAFAHLRELRDGLRKNFADLDELELSMGMTNDFAIAIEEGATLVRIGTALFGARLASV